MPASGKATRKHAAQQPVKASLGEVNTTITSKRVLSSGRSPFHFMSSRLQHFHWGAVHNSIMGNTLAKTGVMPDPREEGRA